MGKIMFHDQVYSSGTTAASGTMYDNTNSGLEANNTQDAIDEVAKKIDDISDASGINYDNSTTGLPANVQGAIDKTTGNISSLDMVELTATAAHAHAAGSTFLWIGQLVKVTTTIAIGDTIAVGTNVANTDICSVLSELNSKYENIIKSKVFEYDYSQPTVAGTRYIIANAKSVIFGVASTSTIRGISLLEVFGNVDLCVNTNLVYNIETDSVVFTPTSGNTVHVTFTGVVFYTN